MAAATNVIPFARRTGSRSRSRTLVMSACDRAVAVQCPDSETVALLRLAFGTLLVPSRNVSCSISATCRIERDNPSTGFHVVHGDRSAPLANADELLFHLDKFLTLTLQANRPELYFLHAAAVALNDCAAVLAAPSGTGKSTLTLALIESGFAYLSDELTPIDTIRLLVYPYAHALCLKGPVPYASRIADTGIAVGSRVHIAAELLRTSGKRGPRPIAAVFFPARSEPSVRVCQPIGAAAAAAHLLANALNGLAHEAAGLNAAVGLAKRVPCFLLNSSDPSAACAAIEAVLRGSTPPA